MRPSDATRRVSRDGGRRSKAPSVPDRRRFLEAAARGRGDVGPVEPQAGAFLSNGGRRVRNPTNELRRDDVDDRAIDVSRDVTELITRARAGDEEAIRTFVERFEHEVRLMVRGRLPRRLRTQFDSMDFVQAVWQSFFVDLKEGSQEFENARHVRGFLAGVARNKVFEQDRRLTRTARYEVAREEPLYVRRGDREHAREVPAHDPSPSENMQASDRLAILTAGRPQREVEVLTLRHEGRTIDEIADLLEIHEKTVRRIITAARERMEARGWM